MRSFLPANSNTGHTMSAFQEHGSDTVSLGHLQVIMPLISLMSTHFWVNSFTLITDMETESMLAAVKIASEFYIKINCKTTVQGDRRVLNANNYYDDNKGYLVLGKSDLDYSKMIKKNPKVIVATYTLEENGPVVPKLFSDLVIPPSVSFFVIPITTSNYFSPNKFYAVTMKCLRLYKPISRYPLKAFPTMFYEGLEKPYWTWESKNTNWYSFMKETRNMSGINITIALVSNYEEKISVPDFWTGKDSFFWNETQRYLHYRPVLHFRQITVKDVKTASDFYARMLLTGIDGIALLPVITSRRRHFLTFIPTGIDQKYHLLVREPQYVHSWNSVFKPLTRGSWICLGIAVTLISITLRLTTVKEKSPIADLSSCFLTIFGYVCFQGCPNVPTNASGRAVCYISLLFSILIYQFYTSNLYSLLSTKEVSLPFNSLEEILEKRTHRLYVHPETAIYSHIMAAKNGTLKKIQDVISTYSSHHLTKDKVERALSRVCKGTAAILGLPSQAMSQKGLKCKLVPVNSGFLPSNTVTALRKNFPFTSQFKFVHLRLKEAGVTQRFVKQYYKVLPQHTANTDVANEAVTMVHVAFLLVLQVAAVILSWIIVGLEITTSRAIKRKGIKRGIKFP